MFNGATLLIVIAILGAATWAFWPHIRAFLGRITTDLFQDIPASHPDAVTGLDRLQADGVIAYAYRGFADPAAAEYAARHHGGAA